MNPKVSIQSSKGQMVFELFADKAAISVANFLNYVDAGLFDGSSFFRIVIENHPQTEDPVKIETIQGGLNIDHPDLMDSIPHESTEKSGLSHQRGSLSMARYELGSANGSFFICFRDEPALDFGGARQPDGQGFAVFGQLLTGYDVLDALYDLAEEGEYLKSPVLIESIERIKI